MDSRLIISHLYYYYYYYYYYYKGGIGSGEILYHDIYPARPIANVSLAANTYCMMDGLSLCAPRTVGPRVQFSGTCVCEQRH